MNPSAHIAERMRALRCAVLIPTYNNERSIAQVVEDVRPYCDDIFVVNDGSTDRTAGILDSLPGITVLGYTPNRGKGYALRTGIRSLAARDFRYMISIDADGQHYASDLERFVAAAEQSPDTLLIGARCLTAENMPSKNTFANRFSNFWYRFETGHRLADTQSGFRLYPLERIGDMRFFTTRYEFEVEVIVRAAWRGVRVENIPVGVYYPPEGERVSHFRPGKDFVRISILNTCLVVWALAVYYPLSFLRRLSWKGIRGLLDRHVMHTPDSNHRMALAVAWGVMWGLMPVWGWQGAAAVVTGHLLRLNKAVAFLASNISIPPMIPPIVLGGCLLGGWLTGSPVRLSFEEITAGRIGSSLLCYLTGSVVLALIGAVAAYALFRVLFLVFKRNPCR